MTTTSNEKATPQVKIRVADADGLIAVVPGLLGFRPDKSLVVLGVAGLRHRVKMAFRYDLPDPADPQHADDIAVHVVRVLASADASAAVIIGYGTEPLVTPVAETVAALAAAAGIGLADVLRVDGGRYWSYLSGDDDGHPVPPENPALGTVATDRDVFAARLAPVRGPDADAMQLATTEAVKAALLLTRSGQGAVNAAGYAAVRDVLAAHEQGRAITPAEFARLTVALIGLPVRDDAWARMDPARSASHVRLWTDVTRHAQPGFAAAPASLLAFAAWQSGDGALANIALERALADQPGYSMAVLLGDALNAGLPPSAATLPMTPEEVAASYTERGGK